MPLRKFERIRWFRWHTVIAGPPLRAQNGQYEPYVNRTRRSIIINPAITPAIKTNPKASPEIWTFLPRPLAFRIASSSNNNHYHHSSTRQLGISHHRKLEGSASFHQEAVCVNDATLTAPTKLHTPYFGCTQEGKPWRLKQPARREIRQEMEQGDNLSQSAEHDLG